MRTFTMGMMGRRLGFALLAAALLAAAAGSAEAQSSDRSARREAVRRTAQAVLTLDVVLEEKSSFRGQQQESERKREATGVVIDPAGLVVTSLSNVDPGQFYARYSGNEEEYVTRVKLLKYVLEDNTEIPAVVVLRDSDLDLAILKPAKPLAKPLPSISLADSTKADLLDEAIAVTRAGRIARRTPLAFSGEIKGVVTKPRPYFLPSDTIEQARSGVPVIAPDGRLIGVSALYVFPGGQKGLGEGEQPYMAVVIPAEDIATMAQQAQEPPTAK